jgi:CheY-like chemotaxis protein
VVVADDHPRVLESVSTMLSRTCDVIATVTSGLAAIDATRQLRPDVVVLDIAMPGLNGFQTAAHIVSSGSDARIVFVSNHTGDDFVLAGVSRGASAFVAKSRMGLDLVDAVYHAHAGRRFVPSAAVLPEWERRAGDRHDLQLYASDGGLVDAMMAYFDNALRAGHSIVAVALDSHLLALDALFARRRLDVESLVARGRYARMESGAALEAVCRNGRVDRALYDAAFDPLVERGLAASTASTPHVSVCGQIAPLLCVRGEIDEMLRLERIASDYARSHPISILCTYSASCGGHDASVLPAICAEHSTIVPAAA